MLGCHLQNFHPFFFFEKDHNKRILGAERALNGPKMRFSNFMKNLTHGISVF